MSNNQALVPETTRIIREKVKRFRSHGIFSYTTPDSHIHTHHGDDSKKVRVILPLIGAEGSKLRVSDEY